jgi:hypothetical protein
MKPNPLVELNHLHTPVRRPGGRGRADADAGAAPSAAADADGAASAPADAPDADAALDALPFLVFFLPSSFSSSSAPACCCCWGGGCCCCAPSDPEDREVAAARSRSAPGPPPPPAAPSSCCSRGWSSFRLSVAPASAAPPAGAGGSDVIAPKSRPPASRIRPELEGRMGCVGRRERGGFLLFSCALPPVSLRRSSSWLDSLGLCCTCPGWRFCWRLSVSNGSVRACGERGRSRE